MEYYSNVRCYSYVFINPHDNLANVSILRKKKCGLESMCSLLKSHSLSLASWAI